MIYVNCHAKVEEIAQDIYSMVEKEILEGIARCLAKSDWRKEDDRSGICKDK